MIDEILANGMIPVMNLHHLQELNPTLEQFFTRANDEQLDYYLFELSNLFYTGVSKEEVEQAKDYLAKIKSI